MQEEFVQNPGEVIVIDDYELLVLARMTIKKIVDHDEAQRLMLDFGNEIASLLMYENGRRIAKIRPMLVSRFSADDNVRSYISESINTWVSGHYVAALILICSGIEGVLLNELQELALDISGEEGITAKRLEEYIKEASKYSIINQDEASFLYELKKCRNNAVHRQFNYSEDQVYEMLFGAIKIIERIYSDDLEFE